MTCEDHLSIFPEDDPGVPICCRYSPLCFLNHDFFLNHSTIVKLFGSIGFPYFDRKRKLYFGIASIITLFAVLLTIYGCCALSTSPRIVSRTYWAGGTVHNITSNTDFTIYIGLRSAVYINCGFHPVYDIAASSLNNPNCTMQVRILTRITCRFRLIIRLHYYYMYVCRV